MKGVIFTELLEMLEEMYSEAFVEDLISECDLPSGGAYTSVGTYDHQEVVKMMAVLSEKTGISVSDLQKHYGQYLFSRFVILYPRYFEDRPNAFDFLESVESKIHVEVRKLDHDANPPTVHSERIDDRTIVLDYRSNRPFADVAEGLIRGCLAHFKENVTLAREDLADASGYRAKFVLTRQAA